MKSENNNDSERFEVLDNEIHDENMNDPNSVNTQMTEEKIVNMVKKTVQIVTEICRKNVAFRKRMNMDNFYSSLEVFMLLTHDSAGIDVVER